MPTTRAAWSSNADTYSTPASRKMASDEVVMFQGHPLDHEWIVKLHKNGADAKKQSRERIVKCRDLYRKTLRVTIAKSWVLRHPDIAATAVEVIPQRQSYLNNLKASVGSVVPSYDRKALGYLDSDRDAAKACRSYMNEWRERNIPHNTFNGKASEDGEYMVSVIPTDADIDGAPDFYETLDANAWDALPDDDKKKFTVLNGRKGKRAKLDDNGRMVPDQKWDRNAKGQTRAQFAAEQKKRPEGEPPAGWERDDGKSDDAHREAVRRYLLALDQQATTVRVISALDVAPFFRRSKDNRRWDLFAAVERSLVYPEDLQQTYGWKNMGDRALILTGFDEHRTTGQYGQLYLYTAYVVHTDKKGIRRPIIAYTVAGQPTTIVGSETPTQQTVGMIDLYETHGLQGPRWFYSGGMYSDDDNPDYCWTPALWPFFDTILSIESIKTSINCAVAANAYTGYWNKPDAKLAELDPEALIDSDNNLVQPAVPPPGEIATTIGDTYPVSTAQLPPDAWKNYESQLASLDAAMAIDQVSSAAGTSARSLQVQNTIGLIAKRLIREGNLYSVIRAGELHLETLSAIERMYGVRWPIHTTAERVVGAEVREAIDHVEFDPAWLGPDCNTKLSADYPEERNLAWIDLVTSGYEAPKPTRSLKDVAIAYGDDDESRLRLEMAEDALWAMPETMQALQLQVATDQGNALMLKVLKLRDAQQLTKQGAPGFPAGVPTSALNGPGEAQQGGMPRGNSVPGNADSSMGGQINAGKQTGSQMAEGEAQMAVGGSGAGMAA